LTLSQNQSILLAQGKTCTSIERVQKLFKRHTNLLHVALLACVARCTPVQLRYSDSTAAARNGRCGVYQDNSFW
jgi:hypothetical protein